MANEVMNRRTNWDIMNAIRNDLGGEYALRIPRATDDGLKQLSKDILSHRPSYNNFVDQLINRIASTIIRNTVWNNPLAEFKRQRVEFGDTIQEVKAGLVRAKTYNPDRDSLEQEIWGREIPHVEANYHTKNRQDYYKLTVDEYQMREAFLSETGLFDLVSALLASPLTTDQIDEFMLMTRLFPEYENNGGFYRVNVPDARTLEASPDDSKMVLKKIRAMAGTLTFPSIKFNAAKMYSHVNREDLVLFGTPEFFANVDVDALAGAFNMDRMTMAGRQITIPEERFGMDGAQAILTTKDFFIVADTLMENRYADNPVGLHRNYFYHHHQIISASRFTPAVLFHTGQDDAQPIEIRPVTGVSTISAQRSNGTAITPNTGNIDVVRGERLYVSATATGADGATPTNPHVSWSLTGATDPRTRITRQGTVHVGSLEDGPELTVKATATFIDPRDPDNQTEQSRTRKLVVDQKSPKVPVWPNPRTPDEEPEPEPTPEP